MSKQFRGDSELQAAVDAMLNERYQPMFTPKEEGRIADYLVNGIQDRSYRLMLKELRRLAKESPNSSQARNAVEEVVEKIQAMQDAVNVAYDATIELIQEYPEIFDAIFEEDEFQRKVFK